MVMSDKTAIVQLKISRIMMLINIGGSRGGHFRHANVEMMCICLGFGLENWKCSENGKNDMKS